MTASLILPPRLRLQLESEARAAFPRECCGLIEGRCNSRDITFLHPVKNLAAQADLFELDPVEHFRLLKQARARNAGIIGCYHSHPNGSTAPSVADLAGAGEENFLWLIAGLTDMQVPVTIAPYIYAEGRFTPLHFAD